MQQSNQLPGNNSAENFTERLTKTRKKCGAVCVQTSSKRHIGITLLQAASPPAILALGFSSDPIFGGQSVIFVVISTLAICFEVQVLRFLSIVIYRTPPTQSTPDSHSQSR